MAPSLIFYSPDRTRASHRKSQSQSLFPSLKDSKTSTRPGSTTKTLKLKTFWSEKTKLSNYAISVHAQTDLQISKASTKLSTTTLRKKSKPSPPPCTDLLKLLILIFNIKLDTRWISGWSAASSILWLTSRIPLLILMLQEQREESIDFPNTPNKLNTRFLIKSKILLEIF